MSTRTREFSTSPIKFYYCVPTRDKALYIETLESIANTIDQFELVLIVSGHDKRLTAARICNELSSDIAAHDVCFCGLRKCVNA
jgi:predicted ferric reductase